VSERKVRLCGYAIAVLMDQVNTVDSALETVYRLAVEGEVQGAVENARFVEQNIDSTLFFLRLAEKVCDAKPDAGRAFKSIAESLRGRLEDVRRDPRTASQYRYYRHSLTEGVKMMLSD
jgi:hypothetical protein